MDVICFCIKAVESIFKIFAQFILIEIPVPVPCIFNKVWEKQGCGSGSGLDPDSVTLWIRIHIGNPDPGSGSRGKKVKKFQWKNALFSY
jgi:hypothetical protein